MVKQGQHDQSSGSLLAGLNVILECGAYAHGENRQIGHLS